MTQRIWIDVDDLFAHAATGGRMTGIFRVIFELSRALAAGDDAGRIGFLRHSSRSGLYAVVPFADV